MSVRGVAVVGAGSAARALVPALVQAGIPIDAVAARNPRSAGILRRLVPGLRVVASPGVAVAATGIVLLAVRDREIPSLARQLVRTRGWDGVVVLHLAGSLGPEVLAPLRRAGAAVGVFHPLQSLGIPGGATLRGAGVRLEGDDAARAAGRRLARALELIPLVANRAVRPSDRAAYHAAASLVANDLVALFDVAEALLVSAGFHARAARRALDALARGTLDNLRSGGPDRALTGPVARGDAEVVSRHLRAIARASPSTSKAHALLGTRLLEIAKRSGRLDAGAARAVAAALRGNTPPVVVGPRRRPTV